MKKITLDEMQDIRGGYQRAMCFAAGASVSTVLLFPALILPFYKVIKFCWDN